MKIFKTLLITIIGFAGFNLNAQENIEMSLSVMYNGKPVCGHEITIKAGGTTLGKGSTDSEGNVKFSGVILNVKDINVYGYKKTKNGEKKWSLEGHVKLDDNYHSDIKMEVYIKEAAKDSGLSEGMLAGAWGLTFNCDGTEEAKTEGGDGGMNLNDLFGK